MDSPTMVSTITGSYLVLRIGFSPPSTVCCLLRCFALRCFALLCFALALLRLASLWFFFVLSIQIYVNSVGLAAWEPKSMIIYGGLDA